MTISKEEFNQEFTNLISTIGNYRGVINMIDSLKVYHNCNTIDEIMVKLNSFVESKVHELNQLQSLSIE